MHRSYSYLTDQSSTALNVKKNAHVSHRVKIKIRKKESKYTRIKLLRSVRLVVRDAQLRTAAMDTRPNKNDGNETTHIKF